MDIFSWIFGWDNNETNNDVQERGPGPARNLLLPTDVRVTKLSLKSVEVVNRLREMSHLGEIKDARSRLRPTQPNPPVDHYLPRHPVLRELLSTCKMVE